jgi:CheY-like chemotaxis protein
MQPLKAVLIDDDASVLSCLGHILQRRGYSIRAYESPVHSPLYQCKGCPCSMHDEGCPNLIISDYCMPMMNGVDLLEFIKSKGCRCGHLALISGNGVPEADLNRVVELGISNFTKPLTLDFYTWLDRVAQG